MAEYRSRLIDQLLTRRMAGLPAVMLMGPRACGKTTTALRHARTVVRMDRAGEAAVFKADPDAALRGLAEPVLLDEWQMVPETLGAVKRAVDEDSRPGRFILAGSLHAMLALPGGWPGAGRVANLEMWPLTAAEQKSTGAKPLLQRMRDGDDLEPAAGGADVRDYIGLAVRGGFPQPALTGSGVRASALAAGLHRRDHGPGCAGRTQPGLVPPVFQCIRRRLRRIDIRPQTVRLRRNQPADRRSV